MIDSRDHFRLFSLISHVHTNQKGISPHHSTVHNGPNDSKAAGRPQTPQTTVNLLKDKLHVGDFLGVFNVTYASRKQFRLKIIQHFSSNLMQIRK